MGVLDFLKTKKGPLPAQIAYLEASLERLRAERRSAEAIVEGHGSRRAGTCASGVMTERDGEGGEDVAAGLARVAGGRATRKTILELQDELGDRIVAAVHVMLRTVVAVLEIYTHAADVADELEALAQSHAPSRC